MARKRQAAPPESNEDDDPRKVANSPLKSRKIAPKKVAKSQRKKIIKKPRIAWTVTEHGYPVLFCFPGTPAFSNQLITDQDRSFLSDKRVFELWPIAEVPDIFLPYQGKSCHLVRGNTRTPKWYFVVSTVDGWEVHFLIADVKKDQKTFENWHLAEGQAELTKALAWPSNKGFRKVQERDDETTVDGSTLGDFNIDLDKYSEMVQEVFDENFFSEPLLTVLEEQWKIHICTDHETSGNAVVDPELASAYKPSKLFLKCLDRILFNSEYLRPHDLDNLVVVMTGFNK